jgi:hypothetical protein
LVELGEGLLPVELLQHQLVFLVGGDLARAPTSRAGQRGGADIKPARTCYYRRPATWQL